MLQALTARSNGPLSISWGATDEVADAEETVGAPAPAVEGIPLMTLVRHEEI